MHIISTPTEIRYKYSLTNKKWQKIKSRIEFDKNHSKQIKIKAKNKQTQILKKDMYLHKKWNMLY